MKRFVKLVAVLIMLLGAQSLFAQSSFYITGVKGKIVKADGSCLSAGMTIACKEMLTFTDSLSSANAIDDKSSVFTMMPLYAQSGYTDAANVVAKLVRKPRRTLSDYYVPETPINDLRDIFGDDQFTLIDKQNKVDVNTAKLKLGPNDMVVLSYIANGERISKRLAVEKGAILLDKSKFSDIGDNGKSAFLSIKCSLYLVNNLSKKYSEVSEFKLNLISREALIAELVMVKRYLESKKISTDLIRSYLTGYFYDIYGRTFLQSFADISNEVMGR